MLVYLVASWPLTSHFWSCELHQWRGISSWISWTRPFQWWASHRKWRKHPTLLAAAHLWLRPSEVKTQNIFLSVWFVKNKKNPCFPTNFCYQTYEQLWYCCNLNLRFYTYHKLLILSFTIRVLTWPTLSSLSPIRQTARREGTQRLNSFIQL